jgi:hypothetical protein
MERTGASPRGGMLPWSEPGAFLVLALRLDTPQKCLSQTCILWGKGNAAGNPWLAALLYEPRLFSRGQSSSVIRKVERVLPLAMEGLTCLPLSWRISLVSWASL